MASIRQPAVSVEVSPAAELLLTVVTVTEAGDDAYDYDIGSDWIAEMRSRAGDALLERTRAVAHRDPDTFIHLIGMAFETPAPRDLGAFFDHLRASDASELKLHLVKYYDRDTRRCTQPATIRSAVAGDPDAQREFLASCHPEWDAWNDYLGAVLSADGESLKREIVEVLEAWAERVWKPESLTVLPILERDAEAKREMARALSLEEFVETATNGVEWVARPGIDRVVMLPSFVHRPLVTFSELGEIQVISYPVGDESVSADLDTPPQRLVRLSKALGDEKRLRILRALADGEKSLYELAEMFGVAKTTMHHHMIVLRSAGLVSVPVGGKRYRLREETVPDVGSLLSVYLGAAPSPTAASPTAVRRRARRGA